MQHPGQSRGVADGVPALGTSFAVTLAILSLTEEWSGVLGACVAFGAAAVVLDLLDPRGHDQQDRNRSPLTRDEGLA